MKTFVFSFCNLSLCQAVEKIVATENLDFGRVYSNFQVYCNEGFFALSITIDKDGTWAYTANKLEGDYVLAGVTTVCEDGEIEYHPEILTREQFNLFKAAADANPHYEDDGRFNGYVEYEDLLANRSKIQK